jgi:heme-degrading monooxygenase HmoA
MTIIKINAITVPAEAGEEVARRFAARVGAVDNQEGFEGFELLRPTDDRTTWLVVSRWRDEDSFNAWLQSPAFAHGHRGVSSGGGEGEGAHGGHGGHGHGGGERPLALNAELWSYEIATSAGPNQG